MGPNSLLLVYVDPLGCGYRARDVGFLSGFRVEGLCC